MLKKLLRDVYIHMRRRRKSNENIRIVCATRLSQEKFWLSSPMGISLQKLKDCSTRIFWDITYENTVGLPKIYNKSIASEARNTIFVFVHDDVWLDADKFISSLDAGLDRFDVVGVAGNTRILPNQPAWAFSKIENSDFIWDWGYLSGAVWHSEPGQSAKLSVYGPCPAQCELMDGVFLAVSAATLTRSHVQFDIDYDFDFYDLDFCRTARQAGLALGTWDIPLIHESIGNFGSDSWKKNFAAYKNKWTGRISNQFF